MEPNNKTKLPGFSHHASDEQIIEYQNIPIEQRLEWLEEILELLYTALPTENWEIMQKFRRGDL